jgi:hypothetical protein
MLAIDEFVSLIFIVCPPHMKYDGGGDRHCRCGAGEHAAHHFVATHRYTAV